jgi:predicted ATP-dependent endonuclease of OLD family
MNSIGFKNFRRFQNFPEIDLGDITILVGGNNAGKSTLVKAMLLMRDFLKSRIEGVDDENNRSLKKFEPQFGFDTEHVNVGDFYRAFCRQSPRKEDTISFTMKIDKFRFVVNIRGERKSGIIPHVSMITVSDEERDILFDFDFSKGQMKVHFEYDRKALNDESEESIEIRSKINQLNRELSHSKDLNKISEIKMELAKLERMASYANDREVEISEYDEITVDMIYFHAGNIGKLVIPELIRSFSVFAETGTTGDKRSQIYNEKIAKKTFLRGKATVINAIAEELENILNSQVIEYIYAHSVAQKPFYADCVESLSSDYTKRTIHEFYKARISPEDDEFGMIKDWLKEFKIGKSLKVTQHEGDNYHVLIFDDENPEIKSERRKGYPGGINLADKGMGSIQLVVMLLRIATFIRMYRGQQLTILLEEPEQNLHPALQSKLAELVYQINHDFGVRFIIETHSEYLIRKSQVIVAGLNKSVNDVEIPFKVYYLPNDSTMPYEMIYREDGNFSNEFGEGFFDTATKLLYDIL